MAFDDATRGRLQRFVTAARRILTDEFARQLQQDYGMDPQSGDVADIDSLSHLDDQRLETARILREILDHYVVSDMGKGAEARDIPIDQRVQASGIAGQLAIGILAALDEPQRRLDQPPLRLALAALGPDGVALPVEDGADVIELVGLKRGERACQHSAFLKSEGVSDAEIGDVAAMALQLELVLDCLCPLDIGRARSRVTAKRIAEGLHELLCRRPGGRDVGEAGRQRAR